MLEHYGVRGVSNEWFRSYLTGRKQFVTINGTDSKTISVNIGVPQGSVLGPLLFLVYMNDLHAAIKNSTVHHFADDTNLLITDFSIKKINKLLNSDLKSLCNWLKSNKISLNVAKTELIVFRHPNKQINMDWIKLKIDGKKLQPSPHVKYLGVYIDQHLSFKHHINDLSTKLRRANGILSKIRNFVHLKTVREIYFAIFESHLKYACQIWGQKGNPACDRLITLQNNAMRIITFSPFRTSSKPLFNNMKILNFRNQVDLQNCLLVHSQLTSTIPVALVNLFVQKIKLHNYSTRNPLSLVQPYARTTRFGLNSITSQCIYSWNKFVNHNIIKDAEWPLSKNSLSTVIKTFFFSVN